MIRYRCLDCRNTFDYNKPPRCNCGNKRKFSEFVVKDNPTPKDLEVLKDPELFNRIIKESEKKAVGEENAKKSLVLFCMGRLVINSFPTSFNAIPHEESGTGKDYLTRTMTSLCVPPEELAHRTRINQTTFTYWHDPQKEPDWTWDGKVLFLEDVGESILNCEVVKTFLSGGSKATITRNQEAVDIIINGKPVCILTTANSSPGGEQLRRIQFIPLDSSREQTNRIKQFQASVAMNGRTPEFDQSLVSALQKLDRAEVVIPFAEAVSLEFPDDLIVRTVQNRFFDLIRASAVLYQFQRSRDFDNRIIAEGVDYENARGVFLHNLSTSETLVPMTIHQKKIVQAMKKRSMAKYGVEDGFMEVSEISGHVALSKDGLYSNLEKLVVSQILGVESGVVLGSGKIGSRYRANPRIVFDLPKFEKIVMGSQNDQTKQTNQTIQTNQNKGVSLVIPVSLARFRDGTFSSDEIKPELSHLSAVHSIVGTHGTTGQTLSKSKELLSLLITRLTNAPNGLSRDVIEEAIGAEVLLMAKKQGIVYEPQPGLVCLSRALPSNEVKLWEFV